MEIELKVVLKKDKGYLCEKKSSSINKCLIKNCLFALKQFLFVFAVIEIKLIYNSLFHVIHVSVDGVQRFRRVK